MKIFNYYTVVILTVLLFASVALNVFLAYNSWQNDFTVERLKFGYYIRSALSEGCFSFQDFKDEYRDSVPSLDGKYRGPSVISLVEGDDKTWMFILGPMHPHYGPFIKFTSKGVVEFTSRPVD